MTIFKLDYFQFNLTCVVEPVKRSSEPLLEERRRVRVKLAATVRLVHN